MTEQLKELNSIYIFVKRVSDNFKNDLSVCFTGDDLFKLIIRLQTTHSALTDVEYEDTKWLNKLINYIQPYSVIAYRES